MTVEVVILAAGKGTRMNSAQPKVLHSIGGKPMLQHVLDTSSALDVVSQHVVVGFGAKQIQHHFDTLAQTSDAGYAGINWVLQRQQLGTGHAVQQALPSLDSGNGSGVVLVLYGDVPLTSRETLEELLSLAKDQALVVLSLETKNPSGLGRILRNGNGDITAIVEEKDASEEQKTISEINTGIMAIPAEKLAGWLGQLKDNNAQGEYYLTDIVSIAAGEGCEVLSKIITDSFEVLGVNDKSQLSLLEQHYQSQKRTELMRSGVTLLDCNSVFIRGNIHCSADVTIDANVVLEGNVSLAEGVSIGANVRIKDSVIGSATTVLDGSNIDGGKIGRSCSIGPSARIRPGTVLQDSVKIGNFVETKNATFGKGSKANHLAYIGDAELGENVNIGAGTIFCNYDGANKHKTTLGDNVFVGSNSVLVAPVNLANKAFVAAGSAVSKDVESDTLVVARARQKAIAGWKRPTKKPK